MPDQDRGFEEVIVEPTGAQAGCDRPDYFEDSVLPYRNNLTALSQTCNLFFAACGDIIHVHQPVSSEQELVSSVLVLETLPSSKAKPVHIYQPIPHGINHLLVGQLGLEEIILCACDDGDVYAYYVRAIFSAIRSSREPPKAFFHENVGASAWGLAISPIARLIAVSSNSHLIDIFALALAEPIGTSSTNSETLVLVESTGSLNTNLEASDEGAPGPSPDNPQSDPECDNPLLLDRSVTVHLQLKGHRSNIPSIAFYDGDKLGRWLVSTDIEGLVLVWDILKNKIIEDNTLLIKEHYFSDENRDYTLDSVPSPEPSMGWGVLCLNPLEFIPTRTLKETWGGNLTPDGRFRDNTPSIANVRNNSFQYPPVVPSPAAEDDPNDSSDSSDSSSQGAGSVTLDSSSVDQLSTHQENSSDDQSSTIESEAESGSGTGDEDPVAPMTIGENASGGGSKQPSPDLEPGRAKINSDPFVVFHTTDLSMRLLINPLDQIDVNCLLRKPLWQATSPLHAIINRVDRLNLVAHVPELGVIVAGSGVGRVAVLSVTRNEVTQELAFRLDHTLPFKSQEQQNERPLSFLTGVAIGPMQGFQTTSDEFRSRGMDRNESSRAYSRTGRPYRLMLTYLDGTVLSYKVVRALYPREYLAFMPIF